MSKNTRTKFGRAKDRETIARLYLQQKTQREIALFVGVSRSQVQYDLAKIQEEWRNSSLRAFDEAKAQELARVDMLERMYQEAFERSIGPKSESTTEKKTGEDGFERAAIKRWEEAGDPRYLDGIEKCIARRCRILGLHAPTKIAPTDPSGENPYSGASDDDLRALALHIAGGHSANDAANSKD